MLRADGFSKAEASVSFEIERKFLVADDTWRAGATEHSRLRQAYLTSDGRASIRVRIKDNREAALTVKSRGAELRRLELEYAIPTLEAEALISLRRGSIIEKLRHKVPFGGLIWEIDEFAGKNAGLVIAEVELSQEHQRSRRNSIRQCGLNSAGLRTPADRRRRGAPPDISLLASLANSADEESGRWQ